MMAMGSWEEGQSCSSGGGRDAEGLRPRVGANLRREAERQSRGAGQRGALPRGGRGRPHSSLKEPFCNSQEGRKPGYDWEPGGFLVA